MPRPTQKAIDQLAETMLGNIENVVLDFEAWLNIRGEAAPEIPQPIVNMAFAAYCSGILCVLNPESAFNKNFKFSLEFLAKVAEATRNG
jgi:hypothetical protein